MQQQRSEPSSQDVITSANKGTQGLTQLTKPLVFSFISQNIAIRSAGSDLQQRSGTRIQFALLHCMPYQIIIDVTF